MSNVPSVRPRAIGELTCNAIGALFAETCPKLECGLFVKSLSKCEHTCPFVLGASDPVFSSMFAVWLLPRSMYRACATLEPFPSDGDPTLSFVFRTHARNTDWHFDSA